MPCDDQESERDSAQVHLKLPVDKRPDVVVAGEGELEILLECELIVQFHREAEIVVRTA